MSSHLASAVRPALDLPNDQRINTLYRRAWIGYELAQSHLAELEFLLQMPARDRPINKLLYGRSDNGKSSIVKLLAIRHPRRILPDGNGEIPVALVLMPSKPDESEFWSAVLNSMKIPHRENADFKIKRRRALDILQLYGTRMVVLDEMHNILQGTVSAQKHFLTILKNLTLEITIPIVAVGTEDALHTFTTDPQFDTRFDPLELPGWKDDDRFKRLLASWEKLLPLRQPSHLADPAMATRLHILSDGVIGGLERVLQQAGRIAINTGEERITLNILKIVQPASLSAAVKAKPK
jgi:hypothetical protein